VNPHKWLFVPVEAACILGREPRALRNAFRVTADYLQSDRESDSSSAIDWKDYGPQLSRSFRALKVWMTFKAYGAARLRAAIESNIEIMRYFSTLVDQSPDFEQLAPAPLSIVCFRHLPAEVSRRNDPAFVDAYNETLLPALERDGRIFLSGTKIHGCVALRACSVNHRLQRRDVEQLLEVIRDVARGLTGPA